MSVIIPGMEMPKNCWECPCFVSDGWFCNLDDECRDVHDGRPDWCQLVELPASPDDGTATLLASAKETAGNCASSVQVSTQVSISQCK